jgi:hypothetical protein
VVPASSDLRSGCFRLGLKGPLWRRQRIACQRNNPYPHWLTEKPICAGPCMLNEPQSAYVGLTAVLSLSRPTVALGSRVQVVEQAGPTQFLSHTSSAPAGMESTAEPARAAARVNA